MGSMGQSPRKLTGYATEMVTFFIILGGGIEVDKVETRAFNFLVVFFIHFGIKGSKGTQ
jgi:hypothetical protein